MPSPNCRGTFSCEPVYSACGPCQFFSPSASRTAGRNEATSPCFISSLVDIFFRHATAPPPPVPFPELLYCFFYLDCLALFRSTARRFALLNPPIGLSSEQQVALRILLAALIRLAHTYLPCSRMKLELPPRKSVYSIQLTPCSF